MRPAHKREATVKAEAKLNPTIAIKLTEKSMAASVLSLPKGRLMVGKMTADFSPEVVVDAARSIITHFEHDFGEETFYSQAGVIEYAAQSCHWNRDPEYKTY